MHRRTFLAVTTALCAARLDAQAQPASGVRRIGVVESDSKVLVEARKEGLRRLGWIEGENIVVEPLRWGDRSPVSLQKLTQDIVRLKLEVIIAASNHHVATAKAATETIPIVMVYAQDPVAVGSIASLARFTSGNSQMLAVLWRMGSTVQTCFAAPQRTWIRS